MDDNIDDVDEDEQNSWFFWWVWMTRHILLVEVMEDWLSYF